MTISSDKSDPESGDTKKVLRLYYDESAVDGIEFSQDSTTGAITIAPLGAGDDLDIVFGGKGTGAPKVGAGVVENQDNKGQADGYASLNGSGLVPTTELGSGTADATTFLRGDRTFATPAGGGVSDGDKGDITVSASGATWTIDPGAVTYAKMQDVSATQRVVGRNTSGSGDPEEVSLSQLLDWIGSATRGDVLYRGASTWSRLAVGSNGQLLKSDGNDPAWGTFTGGGAVLFANTSIPGGNTVTSTSETAFSSSYTIPANSVAVGDVFIVRLSGTYGGTVLPTLEAWIKLGSTSAITTGMLSGLVNGSNLAWRAEARFVVTAIGASGSYECEGGLVFSTSATAALSVNVPGSSTTIDTTASQAITVSVDWGVGGTGQTVTLRQMIVEKELIQAAPGTVTSVATDDSLSGGTITTTGTLSRAALTGDVTASAGSNATTIANSAVTTAKMGGDVTTAGKALLDDADASAQRTTLGLGTMAVLAATARPMVVAMWARGDSTLTLTNMPAAETLVPGSGVGRMIAKVDLSGFTQACLRGQRDGGTAAAGCKLILRYHTSYTTTVGTFSTIGSSAVEVVVDATGYFDTGWIDLVSGAKVDGVFVAIISSGGNGASDPTFGNIYAQFR